MRLIAIIIIAVLALAAIVLAVSLTSKAAELQFLIDEPDAKPMARR